MKAETEAHITEVPGFGIEKIKPQEQRLPPAAGIVIVHPAWPWVHFPEENTDEHLERCQVILRKLEEVVRAASQGGRIITVIDIPPEDESCTAPAHIQKLLNSIYHHASSRRNNSFILEDTGGEIVRDYPNISLWMLGGFWKDLCVCDIHHGIITAGKRSFRPHDWSVWSEIGIYPNIQA